jgi:hypothetical protein
MCARRVGRSSSYSAERTSACANVYRAMPASNTSRASTASSSASTIASRS